MRLSLNDSIAIGRHKLFSPKIISNHVKVETSAECNARCVWCRMFKSENKPRGMMQLAKFKKFVDLNKTYFLAKGAGIMPFFNGECLIHPQVFEILDYIVDNGIRLMDLDTNLAVKINIPKLMSYPFKFIRVNIGGVTKEIHEQTMKTDFALVVGNLKKVFQIDRERIIVKMQVTKKNLDQAAQLADFVKGLGGLGQNAVISTTSFPLPALAFEKEIKDFFDEIVSEEVKDYLKFEYDLSQPRYAIKAKEPGCHYLLNCIAFDGKLTICCEDQLGRLNLGNAFELPLVKLFSTDKYKTTLKKAKNMNLEFCRECN